MRTVKIALFVVQLREGRAVTLLGMLQTHGLVAWQHGGSHTYALAVSSSATCSHRGVLHLRCWPWCHA